MDWLTFASKAIESLAWPLVALALGLVFRQKILDLLPTIRKFKAGPLEAEFERATKAVLVTAEQAEAPPEQAAAPPEQAAAPPEQAEAPPELPPVVAPANKRLTFDVDVVTELLDARGDPAGTILRAWSSVERELQRLGIQAGILEKTVNRNGAMLFEFVVRGGHLPAQTTTLVQDLYGLRNQVTHGRVSPTTEAAQDYVLAAERVVALIQSFRKTHYPSAGGDEAPR